ncbi:hypothetical protein X975_01986, partial [Stegodyphus mimosarum]
MSVFGDFQKAWAQRFPGCELPQAWEEDVRANLTKHRQRVAALNAELEKEEFYVEYLEHLLADVERVKQNPLFINETAEAKEPASDGKKNDESKSRYIDKALTDSSNSEVEIARNICTDELSDQNSYITVIAVGGPNSPSSTLCTKGIDENESHEKVEEKLCTQSDDLCKVETETSSSLQKKKPPAPPKKPRKSIPVQAVPPVKQAAVLNPVDISKKDEKPVTDTCLMDNLNTTLVNQSNIENTTNCAIENSAIELLESSHKVLETSGDSCILKQNVNVSHLYDDENIYDTVAPDEGEISSSNTLASDTSKEDCEGDYVVFSEAYDSYQECPPAITSRSRIAECLLTTQRSVEEESPEYATYMNIDYFLKKGTASKALRTESVGGDSDDDDDAFLARSFSSDHEVEPDQVADYTEKKNSATSAPTDDVFELDSG